MKRRQSIVMFALLGIGFVGGLAAAAAGLGNTVLAHRFKESVRSAVFGPVPPAPPRLPLYEVEAAEQARLPVAGKIVLLGDSLVSQGHWSELLPDAKIANRGISGDTVDGIAKRAITIASGRPRQVLVMAGINDLRRSHDQREVERAYGALIDTFVNAQVPLVIFKTLRIGRGRENADYINVDVDRLNVFLEAAARRGGVTLVDLNPELTGADGKLRSDFTSDGVHLTGAAYDIWSKQIAAVID